MPKRSPREGGGCPGVGTSFPGLVAPDFAVSAFRAFVFSVPPVPPRRDSSFIVHHSSFRTSVPVRMLPLRPAALPRAAHRLREAGFAVRARDPAPARQVALPAPDDPEAEVVEIGVHHRD